MSVQADLLRGWKEVKFKSIVNKIGRHRNILKNKSGTEKKAKGRKRFRSGRLLVRRDGKGSVS